MEKKKKKKTKSNMLPPEILAKKRAEKKIQEAINRGDRIIPAHYFTEEMNKINETKLKKERKRAEAERQMREEIQKKLEAERKRAELYKRKLIESGINPDDTK